MSHRPLSYLLIVSALMCWAGCQKQESPGQSLASDSFAPHPPYGAPRPRHFVYVIDGSGSMSSTWPMLKGQMILSIAHLEPVQDFHVVFFSPNRDDPPPENGPRQLTPATKQSKAAVADFLDTIQTSGDAVASPALQRAFEVLRQADTSEGRSGKLIYLLSDGDLNDWPDPIEVIREMDPDKGVRIYTFLYAEEEHGAAADMLKEIASESGGEYKYVSPDSVY